jgi:phage repressor protein C with HTH and peptisase S24 domain
MTGSTLKENNLLAFQVTGNNMAPEFQERDIVIASVDTLPNNGDFVIAGITSPKMCFCVCLRSVGIKELFAR